MIVGLSGYARSGKDTFADILVEEYGFTRIAFADTMRNFLYVLNPMVKPRYERSFSALVPDQRLQDVIDRFTWDGYKATPYGKEIRELMQRLGTECGRAMISDTVWIDAALKGISGNVVVTDVRFPNEAYAIEETYDGRVLRINRPGVGPANDHPSETSLDDHDFYQVIENDGTLEDFADKVRKFIADERYDGRFD